ncbi:MAG: hypothetical protein ACR2FV_07555 [Ornithinimicrobium sp.]
MQPLGPVRGLLTAGKTQQSVAAWLQRATGMIDPDQVAIPPESPARG